jgi:kinesin family protein 11
MQGMAVQMQALDEFVTRARSQNGRHHQTHAQSLEGLTSTVRQSYSNAGEYFISSSGRMRDLGSDISSRTSTLQASLPQLDANVRQPLAELRTNVAEAPLKEYVPTGETPQKSNISIQQPSSDRRPREAGRQAQSANYVRATSSGLSEQVYGLQRRRRRGSTPSTHG